MSDDVKDSSEGTVPEIRITRMNADKTRQDIGSATMYHVYFELSVHPPSGWRDLFAGEWERMKMTRAVSIDGGFLVLQCALEEVAATQLPALKKAVVATNAAYQRYLQTEATAREHREDVWKQERKTVEAMGSTLRFE